VKTTAFCPPLQHSVNQSVIPLKAVKLIIFKTIWKHCQWLVTGPSHFTLPQLWLARSPTFSYIRHLRVSNLPTTATSTRSRWSQPEDEPSKFFRNIRTHIYQKAYRRKRRQPHWKPK